MKNTQASKLSRPQGCSLCFLHQRVKLTRFPAVHAFAKTAFDVNMKNNAFLGVAFSAVRAPQLLCQRTSKPAHDCSSWHTVTLAWQRNWLSPALLPRSIILDALI